MFIRRQDVIDQFASNFRDTQDGGILFQPKHAGTGLPITWDEYHDVMAAFERRQMFSMAITWALMLAAFAWGSYRSMRYGDQLNFLGALGGAFLLSTALSFRDGAGLLAPLRLRLDALVEDSEADARPRRRTRRRAAKGTIGTVLMLVILPICFLCIALIEHSRRVEVLGRGEEAVARVVPSDVRRSRGLCVVDYNFRRNGTDYSGSIVSCDVMQRYPVGSDLPVRFDPEYPEDSLAVGESVWPPYAVAALLTLPGFFIGAILAFGLVKDRYRSRKRRRRVRP